MSARKHSKKNMSVRRHWHAKLLKSSPPHFLDIMRAGLSYQFYFDLFNNSPNPISITTLSDHIYIAVNQAWLEASRLQLDQVLGRSFKDIVFWDMLEKLPLEEIEKYYPYSSQDHTGEFWLTSSSSRTICWSSSIISDKHNSNSYVFSIGHDIKKPEEAVGIDLDDEPHILAVIRDIHELKQANEALRLSEDKFSTAFNASISAMCISTMCEGRLIEINDSFCRVLDYRREEMLGRTVYELELWENPEQRREIERLIVDHKSVRDMEILFVRKSGERRVGLYSAEGIEIDGKQCLLSIVTDITDQKKAEAEVRYLSFHDKLTGLYNRAYFEEELKRLDTSRNLPMSLIMGDVNGLKLINDALGHHEGDKLLIAVASVLKHSCRSEDIVARLGGDEFIILLPGCSYDGAAAIVDRIKKSEALLYNLLIQTSISLGIATKTNAELDIHEFIKEAEDKMYRNKLLENRSTRNYFLNSLEKTLWSRSHETREHCERIQQMSLKIAKCVDLPASELDNLKLLATLHDIGKIAIPNNILDRPGKLTQEEWDAIKKHPEIGYRIALSSPEMSPIAEAILHHHERWDGGGYPLGLRGKDIPFLSRIIAIADTFDVMVNGRPYQSAVTPEEAWNEIISCAGSQFDPELVKRISSNKFTRQIVIV